MILINIILRIVFTCNVYDEDAERGPEQVLGMRVYNLENIQLFH